MPERVAMIRRVAQLHAERRDHLADVIVREMGKPRDEALGEVDFCVAIYEFYADNAEAFLADETITLLGGQGSAVVKRGPIGVLLGIMPWNFPYYQVARFAGPNLVVGNTILLKHAPQCPENRPKLLAAAVPRSGIPARRLHRHPCDQRTGGRPSSPTPGSRRYRSPGRNGQVPQSPRLPVAI